MSTTEVLLLLLVIIGFGLVIILDRIRQTLHRIERAATGISNGIDSVNQLVHQLVVERRPKDPELDKYIQDLLDGKPVPPNPPPRGSADNSNRNG
jgi:hypothetical protein